MMNMVSKSSSILMAIGIVAVAAVAIIGLGYAYTASSTNTGNELDASYLTVSQTAYADGFEDNAVVFNTSKTGAETVTYTLSGTASKSTGAAIAGIELGTTPTSGYYVSGEGGKIIYELGSNAYTIEKTGMDSMPTYSLKFKTTAGTLDTSHYNFYVSVGDSKYYAFTGTEITIATGLTDTSATVHLYMANGEIGPTSASQKPMTGVTFVLTAEVVPTP